MAIDKSEIQVTWDAGSNTNSLAAAASEASDAMTMTATAGDAWLQVKADNAGTPASGDTIDVKVLYSLGDPDGTGTDEYDTQETAPIIFQLDTNTVDPVLMSAPINHTCKGFKVFCESNASSNSITVSATVYISTA